MPAYPSYRYHRTLPPAIVQDEEEDTRLGGEWAATPAAFLALPEEPCESPAPAAEARQKGVRRAKASR